MKQLAPEIKRHYTKLAATFLSFFSISLLLQLTNGLEWASMHTPSVQSGEIWRLITGHLIHLDWSHFAMNMLALGLSLVVFKDDMKPVHWVGSFLFISLFSSICMLFAYMAHERYVGFSDVIHGWILVGAASIAYKEPKLAAAIFILFWIKILEENYELTFFTSYGVTGNVAKESHIYGGISGTIYGLIFIKSLRERLKALLKFS